jgi:hypothetical protein
MICTSYHPENVLKSGTQGISNQHRYTSRRALA